MGSSAATLAPLTPRAPNRKLRKEISGNRSRKNPKAKMPKAVEAMKNRFSSARAALPYTGAAAPITAMYTVTLA